MFDLRRPSRAEWLATVLGDLDSFLVDHAACERKASALGMSFVVRYPDRHEMLDELIAFSREELEHFHIMYRVLRDRGLTFANDYQDEYVGALRKLVRTGREERLLDMLVLAGVVEARGCERMGLVRDALPDGELQTVYEALTRASTSLRLRSVSARATSSIRKCASSRPSRCCRGFTDSCSSRSAASTRRGNPARSASSR
ncbi:MAG: tRNA isopentenyl-2-thiomethyl-A-37 hydroxylase MiaE [Polyangiaceae bacterium]